MQPNMNQVVSDVFVATLLIFSFGPILLVVLLGLVTPGRKGSLRTTWHAQFPGDVARVRSLLATRLMEMGFEICPTEATQIRASRPRQRQGRGAFELHTHASRPMEADLRLTTPKWDHVDVEASIWLPDFTIVDTGEGRHIDQVMARILAAENVPFVEPDPVPNLTMKASTALVGGCMLIVAAFAQLHSWFDLPRTIGFVQGLASGAMVTCGMGLFGMVDTIRRPKEMRGRWHALAGMALAIIGAAIAFAIFMGHHGPEYLEWMKKK